MNEEGKQLTFDFHDGNGPVPAARHTNPDGSNGGWVAVTATVEVTVHVSGDAWVYGGAQVFGNAQVSGGARVYGNARVSGNARVYGDAWVYGGAQVFGDAQVYGGAQVFGNAQVSGGARVYGNARVSGGAQVFGDAWEASPLQIQGTMHFANMATATKLQIGCRCLPISEWIERAEQIGEEAGYSAEQIAEYVLYVKLAATLYPTQEDRTPASTTPAEKENPPPDAGR